jgi:SAM-dependent methyltransferase
MDADPLATAFAAHQDLLLPHTARHIGRTNLDVGCGSGMASVIHAERLGSRPSLCDVIDIRHPRARALPFRLIAGPALPFAADAFDSSYLQYVLHHLPQPGDVAALIAECARVARAVVIVEEVRGPRTDVARAREFDHAMNAQLHPGVAMPVHAYATAEEIAAHLAAAGAPLACHVVVSEGTAENGFLETHVFAGRRGPLPDLPMRRRRSKAAAVRCA